MVSINFPKEERKRDGREAHLIHPPRPVDCPTTRRCYRVQPFPGLCTQLPPRHQSWQLNWGVNPIQIGLRYRALALI